MYVKFDFTEDDLVDASKRFLGRQTNNHSSDWKNSLLSALAIGVLLFMSLRSETVVRLLLSLAVAGIIILVYPKLQQSSLEGRLRRIAKELMPPPGPYSCEVEIRPAGLWLRQMNKQTIHEWPSLEAVEETSDSVDLFTRDGGGVIVRNRAFASDEERSRFIALIKSHLIQSRS